MLTIGEDTYEGEILWIGEHETKFPGIKVEKSQFEKNLKEKALTLEKNYLRRKC